MTVSVAERVLFGGAICATICLALAPIPAAGQLSSSFLEVSRSESGFTVEAEDTPLPAVLTAIGKHAGFTVQDSRAERPPLSVFEVRDATLETTLRRLLANSNHLIIYRGGASGLIVDGSIERIVLLSPTQRSPAAPSEISSLAGPGGTAKPRWQAYAKPGSPRRYGASREPATDEEFEDEEEFAEEDSLDDEFEAELEYGDALQELGEEAALEQLDVDPEEIAAGEPGMFPDGLETPPLP